MTGVSTVAEYTPDPADVEIAARALSRVSVGQFGERLREKRQPLAEAVVRDLGEAGRLLPAGGETEVLWGRWSPVGILPCDRSDAAGCANQPEQHHTRTVTTFPDGSVYTSAWRPVDE